MLINRKKQYSLYISENALIKFQKMYPELLAVFIRKSVYKALNNKQYFEDIFFNELDFYSEVVK